MRGAVSSLLPHPCVITYEYYSDATPTQTTQPCHSLSPSRDGPPSRWWAQTTFNTQQPRHPPGRARNAMVETFGTRLKRLEQTRARYAMVGTQRKLNVSGSCYTCSVERLGENHPAPREGALHCRATRVSLEQCFNEAPCRLYCCGLTWIHCSTPNSSIPQNTCIIVMIENRANMWTEFVWLKIWRISR